MELKKKVRRASNINGILLILFELLVFGVVKYAISPLTLLFAEEGTAKYNAVDNLLSYTLQYIVGVALPLFVFYRMPAGKELSKKAPLFAKPKMSWGWIIKFIFISFFIIYLVTLAFNFIMNLVQRAADVEFHAVDFSAEDNTLSRLTNVIAMMFFAPFFEELLFRGTLVRNSSRYGGWYAVIAGGILFGLWHMNYEQTFATIAFGICAGFIYVKTRSILPTMLLHLCFNTIGTINSIVIDGEFAKKVKAGNAMELLAEEPAKYLQLTLMGSLVIGLMITGAILLGTELSKHPESFKLEKQDEDTGELTEKRKLGLYFTAPFTVLITLALLTLTVLRGAGIF